MALTTSSKVWKITFLVFIFLNIFFAILFYFEDIFIVLIIGCIMVLVTDRILTGFNKRFHHKSRWEKRIYATAITVMSVLLISTLMLGQLSELNSIIYSQDEYESGISSMFSTYGGMFMLPGGDNNISMGEAPGTAPERGTFNGTGNTNVTATAPILSGEDMQSISNYIFDFFSSMISRVSYYFFTGLLIIPMMFRLYFSKKGILADEFIGVFPLKYQQCVKSSLSDIGRKLGDYFYAKILESVIVGLICCIGFYLAGIGGWFFLGFLAGLLNIVPYIGPVVGAIPAVIVAFIVSPTTALYAIITVVIAQLVDNLYLIPYMISGKVAVNPLLSVVLTLIFADLLGALGMILAIPTYIVYKIVLTEFYHELLKIYPDGE